MKQYVLIVSLLGGLFSCHANTMVGWQELPRVTLAEKCIATAMQAVSASVGVYFADFPKWAHALAPSAGVLTLGPSVVIGWNFKKKAAALKLQKKYDPKDLTDPLFYVNTFDHPFNPSLLIVSGAGLWKAYCATDPELQPEFAFALLKGLDYDSCEWALRAVTEAKRHTEKALQDLKRYSDIEERLNRIIYFQEQGPVVRMDHLLGAEPHDLEAFVQQILDSGTYCQEVTINTVTKYVNTQEASPWYEDDFVYYYASWYGFELLKVYSRLLALEKIWSLSRPS